MTKGSGGPIVTSLAAANSMKRDSPSWWTTRIPFGGKRFCDHLEIAGEKFQFFSSLAWQRFFQAGHITKLPRRGGSSNKSNLGVD